MRARGSPYDSDTPEWRQSTSGHLKVLRAGPSFRLYSTSRIALIHNLGHLPTSARSPTYPRPYLDLDLLAIPNSLDDNIGALFVLLLPVAPSPTIPLRIPIPVYIGVSEVTVARPAENDAAPRGIETRIFECSPPRSGKEPEASRKRRLGVDNVWECKDLSARSEGSTWGNRGLWGSKSTRTRSVVCTRARQWWGLSCSRN